MVSSVIFTTARCLWLPVLSASTTSGAYLPSPPSSTDGIDDSSPEPLPVDSTQPDTKALSHKRRLSDADSVGVPKRPCTSIAGPRLHAVSDPLPRSIADHSIDDWYNANFNALFDIPPPVDATEPDFSTPWEVEMFRDYNLPNFSKSAPKFLLTREYITCCIYKIDVRNL